MPEQDYEKVIADLNTNMQQMQDQTSQQAAQLREMQNDKAKTPEEKIVLAPIKLDDNSDISDIATQINAAFGTIQEMMEANSRTLQDNVQATFSQKDQAVAEKEVAAFKAKVSHMDNREVLNLMAPMYDSGKSLEESYKLAIKALDLTDAAIGSSDGEPSGFPPRENPAPSIRSSQSNATPAKTALEQDTEKRDTMRSNLAKILETNKLTEDVLG